MECTQRLDFELSQSQTTERKCPEQIGFLGILGTKHPVKRGPNKIGRDPQTCNIVLNLNSISRQHAVLNVLSGKDFMLMDLDSANKTRINNKSLQAYIPVAISNGDTVQFGEVFGIFRLLEEDTDLPSTQAIEVPDSPATNSHTARLRHADSPGTEAEVPDTPAASHATRLRHATVPESPDVSDKDDSFIVPSQPKPQHKFRGPVNNFIKTSSKTISIQPIGTNKIDNVYWSSSNKSNSFHLDDSNNSLNESRQNGDINDRETQPPDDSTDSLYTAETQLPPKIASIYSQDTQFPINDNIFNAETQLPKEISPKSRIDEGIYEADTQLPFDQPDKANNNIFEAETQLPSKNMLKIDDNSNKSIHERDTQLLFPIHNASTDSIYMAETQLPPANASPSIYSQETQLPKLDDCGVRDSPKSIYDVNTQLPLEEPNVLNIKDSDIFDAETQISNRDKASNDDKINHDTKDVHQKLPNPNEIDDDFFNAATQKLTVEKFNVCIDLKHTLTDKSENKLDKSDEVILFNEVDAHDDFDDLNASQPILCGDIPLIQEESDDIPLSQSDTITDDDFEIRLEDSRTETKPAERDAGVKSKISMDCEELDLLPTQKIPDKPVKEDEDTDCEEDEIDGGRSNKLVLPTNSKSDFNDLTTQVIPEAGPSCRFDELATQVIPEINADNNAQNPNSKINKKSTNEQNLEDMLTQVIPEHNSDKAINFADLPTQLVTEDVASRPSTENLQYSEEILASPFKIPLQTPIKLKKKDIPYKISDVKSSKSPLAKSNTSNDGDEKYYAATQEIFDDLCSQQDSSINPKTDITLKNKANKLQETKEVPSSVEDGKFGTMVANFEGEMEISVKKFARESSLGSSDGEEKINRFVNNLSAKQISAVIGADVTMLKRVPSDPSDVNVTPKKVRPGKFMETLLPDSQEIKTTVSLSTKTEETDSSDSESEQESQEQTPIVFRKKKRAKADVKKDLKSKFDIDALPTRIITRTRKPTSKMQENDSETKKRRRNILKPKFLNDSEQDEVDTEIISENITRLRNKNDKKNHKDTSVDDEGTEEVKPESNKRKSNEENFGISKRKADQDNRNKSKNNSKDNVVDLTIVDEEKPKSRRKNDKPKNNKDVEDKSKTKTKSTYANTTSKTEVDKHKSGHDLENKSKNNTEDIIVDLTTLGEKKPRLRRNNINSKSNEDISKNSTKLKETDTSKEMSQETRKIGRLRKKDVQDKITNYTLTTDESKISNTISKVDKNSLKMKDVKNITVSTRRGNKDTSNRDKSVQEEQETAKRKRGRSKKDDGEKQKDSKDKKEDKKVNKEAKKRKAEDKQEEVEQPEIRRSRRQKISKDNSQSTSQNHEQSTVYSVSSESGVDSPKRKRKDVTIDAEAPNSKRTRSNTGSVLTSSDTNSVCTTVTSNASSLRSTPSRASNCHYVLFTAFPNEEVKAMLEKLGAVIVSDVSACSVVLTLQLKRTFKLLCAVGLGRPIVGPEWVQACHDNGTLVDPWQHILRDSANEARFRFSLPRTLKGARNYLRGYHVSSTRSVLPSAPEMKLIVECSGGVWGAGGAPGRWLVVSCLADRAEHAALRGRGATLVSSELILSGVLRQELDIEAHLLK